MKRTSVLLFLAVTAAAMVAFAVGSSVASGAVIYCQGSACGPSGTRAVTPTNTSGNDTACPVGTTAFTFSPLAAEPSGAVLTQTQGSTTVTLTLSNDSPITSASFSVSGGTAVLVNLHGGNGSAGTGGVNSTNHYSYGASGVSSDTTLRFPGPLSNVTVCVTSAVLAVTAHSFNAARTGRAVTFRWQTASEANVLGFNVYRKAHGKLVRLNKRMVPAASLSKTASSHAYSFRAVLQSRKLAASSRFVLAEVHNNGSRTMYGPVRASAAS